jgi:hypothetical protein
MPDPYCLAAKGARRKAEEFYAKALDATSRDQEDALIGRAAEYETAAAEAEPGSKWVRVVANMIKADRES